MWNTMTALVRTLGWKLDLEHSHIPSSFRRYASTWLLSPHQHALESLLFFMISLPCSIFFFRKAMNESSWKNQRPLRQRTISDSILSMFAFSGVACTVYYKAKSVQMWRIPYVLQPCHMLSLLLSWTSVSSCKSAQLFFHLYVTVSWSSVLAICMPDMSDYEYMGEAVNYWWEHIVMLAVPLLLLYTRRFEVVGGTWWSLLGYIFIGIYHFIVLEIASLSTGVNISTMMSPPPGMDFAGIYYRPVFFGGLFIFHMVYNYLLHGALSYGFKRNSNMEKERIE